MRWSADKYLSPCLRHWLRLKWLDTVAAMGVVLAVGTQSGHEVQVAPIATEVQTRVMCLRDRSAGSCGIAVHSGVRQIAILHAPFKVYGTGSSQVG